MQELSKHSTGKASLGSKAGEAQNFRIGCPRLRRRLAACVIGPRLR